MDLIDLLENHTVMTQINHDGSVARTVNIGNTQDCVLDNNNTLEVWYLLSFDEQPTTYLYATASQLIANFSGTITYQSVDVNYFNSIIVYGTHTGSTVKVRIKMGAGGNYVYSSYCDLDLHKSYVHQMLFLATGTDLYTQSIIQEVDEYGNYVSAVANVVDSANHITGDTDTLTDMTLQARLYSGYSVEMKLYELDLVKSKKYRVYNAVSRALVNTYYTDTYIANYVLPPMSAFDGSAYDRSYILQDQIEELESDITTLQSDVDDLTTALATANAEIVDLETDISTLQTALDTKPTLAQTLASRISGVNTKTVFANLLTHLADANPVFDFEEAV